MKLLQFAANALVLNTLLSFNAVQEVSSYPSLVIDRKSPQQCIQVDYPLAEKIYVEYTVSDAKEKSKRNDPRSHLYLEINPVGDIQEMIPESRVIRPLLEKTGKVQYDFEFSGIIEICVMLKAGPSAPISSAMISLKVLEEVDEEKFHRLGKFMPPDLPKNPGITSQEERELELNNNRAKSHMSMMERNLHRMVQETDSFLTNADFMKEEEAKFHQKSIEMNAISRYWPILHIIVLLVTGFTQVNHMIKFFRSRNII